MQEIDFIVLEIPIEGTMTEEWITNRYTNDIDFAYDIKNPLKIIAVTKTQAVADDIMKYIRFTEVKDITILNPGIDYKYTSRAGYLPILKFKDNIAQE